MSSSPLGVGSEERAMLKCTLLRAQTANDDDDDDAQICKARPK